MKKRIAVFLIVALSLVSIFGTFSTASARASDYFNSYAASINKNSDNTISVDFTVTATDVMPTLGVSSIQIQKLNSSTGSWTTSYTFTTSNTSGLQTSSKSKHSNTVTSSSSFSAGTYRAYVTFYAKDASGSDSKTYTTTSVVIS